MSHTLGGYPAIGKGDESSCSVENMNLHHSRNGVIDNVATRSLRVDLTHGEGYSGGPYFYDGLTAGGRQYVYGVHAGSYWNNIVFNRAAKGPKVPYYYDAILALR